MKKHIIVLILFLGVAMFATSCKSEAKETKNEASVEIAEKYQCPMDCEKGKTYEKEGKCPVCKMKLKKVSEETEKDENHDH